MNARQLIVLERLRHAPLWSGSANGIYANYSDYPNVEFYTKCPRCAAVHGSFTTLQQAQEKRICPVCRLEDVDKLKEWVRDAVYPEPQKPGQKPKKFKSPADVLGTK